MISLNEYDSAGGYEIFYNPQKPSIMYNLLFHYNTYTKFWYCFDRSDQFKYWNHKKEFEENGRIGIGDTVSEALQYYMYNDE